MLLLTCFNINFCTANSSANVIGGGGVSDGGGGSMGSGGGGSMVDGGGGGIDVLSIKYTFGFGGSGISIMIVYIKLIPIMSGKLFGNMTMVKIITKNPSIYDTVSYIVTFSWI